MTGIVRPAEPQVRSLLDELATWSEQGWLRRLDSAFARFVVERWPAAPAPVVLAAALLAHVEGRGHSCLLIDRLLDEGADGVGLLGLAPPAVAALQRQLRVLPRAPSDWLAALGASPLVRVDSGRRGDGETAADARPLVLSGNRLYLRRYWVHEQAIAAQVALRSARVLPIDRERVRHWLDRLFPASAGPLADAAGDGVDWQKAACGLALAGNLSVITGGPGTGKTYTAARLLALLLAVDPAPERLRIALAAPTGKAAARLREAIGAALQPLQAALGDELPLAALAERIGPARTLHSLLGARPETRRFGHDAAHPLEIDVLIVDEASMVHLEMMAALFDALPAGARLILLGDKDQLASVEAGAVLGDLCRDAELGRYRPATAALLTELTGTDLPECFVDHDGPALAQHTVMLRRSRRFGGPIGRLALAVNRGDQAAVDALLDAPPDASLRLLDSATPAPLVRLASGAGYRDFLAELKKRPPAGDGQPAFDGWVLAVLKAFERFRVLCAVRDSDWGAVALNRAIEAALFADDRRGVGGWYEGRPVMVSRNDATLGVFNGDIGIALRPLAAARSSTAVAQPPLRAYFADSDGRHRSVAISRLAHVETAFAMTVHKAQGSEFEHCALVLPQAPSRVLTRELVYTGITRARSQFTLVSSRRQALADAVATRTVRSSGLLSERNGAGAPAPAR